MARNAVLREELKKLLVEKRQFQRIQSQMIKASVLFVKSWNNNMNYFKIKYILESGPKRVACHCARYNVGWLAEGHQKSHMLRLGLLITCYHPGTAHSSKRCF